METPVDNRVQSPITNSENNKTTNNPEQPPAEEPKQNILTDLIKGFRHLIGYRDPIVIVAAIANVFACVFGVDQVMQVKQQIYQGNHQISLTNKQISLTNKQISLTSDQIRQANIIQQVLMMRELAAEFYGRDGKSVYSDMRTTISSCKRLYNGDLNGDNRKIAYPKDAGKGKDYDEINHYLGFFDNLEFYEEQGAITDKMINHAFGAAIIEAYESNQVNDYIIAIQKGGETDSFTGFQTLAKHLEGLGGDNLGIKKNAQICNKVIAVPRLH